MLHRYGHMWQAVDKFYSCFFRHLPARQRPARIILPGHATHASHISRLMQAAFSGPALSIQLSETSELGICSAATSSERPCCGVSDAAVASVGPHIGLAQLHVSWVYTLPSKDRSAMRALIYANLGLEASLEPDTVVFIATGNKAANGRHLHAEADVVQRVRAYFARDHAHLRFWVGTFEQMTFADEVRLLRRTRVLIGLFGSAFQNCRLLPPDAIVLEIHGALREDCRRPPVR